MKIAKYGLDNWVDLREYTPMDTIRQQLKLCSSWLRSAKCAVFRAASPSLDLRVLIRP